MQQLVEFIGNHPVLATLWVVLAIFLLYSYVETLISPLKHVSTQEATQLMNKEDAVILDIRNQADFKKGHILGAKQIGQEAVTKADFTKLENEKNKPIIVVCAMGISAKRTASQMLKAGFAKVSVLKGGMNTWQGEGLPIKK